MYINTKALILRETEYKESSKILTVLTADKGKLTVIAKGVKRKNNKWASAIQLFAFSDMTLLESRDMWILTEAQSIELFDGLRSDLERLSLASYFSEVLEALSDEDMPNPELLSLGLNCLYALSETNKSQKLIKACFELRAACIAGFTPDVFMCCVCGKQGVVNPRLDLEGGQVRCRDCHIEHSGVTAVLCPGSLDAIRYVVNASLNKLFSFTLGTDAEKNFCEACEKFLLIQLDRGFYTLNFYKSYAL